MKQMLNTVFGAFLWFLTGTTLNAQSFEVGMTDLAGQIAARSQSNTATTLAISPFQHLDGSCSQMSVHIVDELILNLLMSGGPLQLVERSQLQSILDELAFSGSGLVDATAPQEIGRLLGAEAWVVGTITTIGDRYRISAKLIETETGKLFSAAAVSIPRTDTLKDFEGRLIPGGCAFDLSSSRSGDQGQQLGASRLRTNEALASRTDEQLLLEVVRISTEIDEGKVEVFQRVTNQSDRRVRLVYLQETATAFDDHAQSFWSSNVAGVGRCGGSYNGCFNDATILDAGEVIQISYRMHLRQLFDSRSRLSSSPPVKPIAAPNFLTFRGQFRFYTGENDREYEERSLSLADVPVP